MAQAIEYYDNDVVLTEGPFVICNPHGNGWRIELELKGHKCPVLPDTTIYTIMHNLGLDGKTHNQKKVETVCDALNAMVKDGKIVLVGKCWLPKPN